MNIIRIQGQNAFLQGVYYEFDRDSTPVGEGGMGVLYLGARVHVATGVQMPVVIKAIRDEISTQPHLIARAMREASVQIDNENLLRMYDFVSNYEASSVTGVSIIRYYIVMEYLAGISLDKILEGTVMQNEQVIPLAQEINLLSTVNRVRLCVLLMRHLLSGALALHHAGFIHRDLDPSNVMVTQEGKVKIIDFGICKNLNDASAAQLSAPGAFMGKVHYAAPELILGSIYEQNATTDIYALGIILYQLYTGELPSAGLTDHEAMQQHLKGRLPDKKIENREIRRIFKKATENNQRLRYQSAAEFLVDLERVEIPGNKVIFQEGPKEADVIPVPDVWEIPRWAYLVAGFAGVVVGGLLLLL